jgi:hypothetical protein
MPVLALGRKSVGCPYSESFDVPSDNDNLTSQVGNLIDRPLRLGWKCLLVYAVCDTHSELGGLKDKPVEIAVVCIMTRWALQSSSHL